MMIPSPSLITLAGIGMSRSASVALELRVFAKSMKSPADEVMTAEALPIELTETLLLEEGHILVDC